MELRTVRVRAELATRVAVVIVLVAAVTFASSAAAVADGEVAEWEADVLRFVNGWPDVLEPLFWVIQQAGVLGAPAIGGLLLAWWGRRWAYAVPFLALGPLKLGVEWLVIKQLIERGRPWETVPDVELRGPVLDNSGFPSGHSTTAMAFALLVAAFLPTRWRPVALAWAVLVGVARLYYAEHNTLDVVGGFAVGSVYGVVLWLVFLNRLVPEAGEPTRAGETP